MKAASRKKIAALLLSIIAWFAAGFGARAAGQKSLPGHVPAEIAKLHLKPLGRLPAGQHLRLLFNLPLRNPTGLSQLLQQLYTPGSPNFQHYLSPADFTRQFGPTTQDYQAAIDFAAANSFTVKHTYGDRVFIEVDAPVSTVEKALHITMQTYPHPTEARQFFAPDVEPTVDAAAPIFHIVGLSDFSKPRSMAHPAPANATPNGGSVNGTYFIGQDFRHAYAPDISLTGSNQTVGLVEFQGYYLSDITNYEKQSNLSPTPHVPIQNIQLPGYSDEGNQTGMECPLDIEMAIAMAPGLAGLVVFEGITWDEILQCMATNIQVKCISSSWAGNTGDPTAEGYLMQMAAQGQTFFQASGDGDAWVGPVDWPCDDPNVTSVGGTTLTMNGTGASYASETVWNVGYNPPGWSGTDNGYWGSGGGVSSSFSIPWWQTPVNMTSNNGSTNMRNLPDVTMVGNYVWAIYGNGSSNAVAGTSCSAPLWAGFGALVNQMRAAHGLPPAGFLNPNLYACGLAAAYTACFHDTTNGNNTGPGARNQYLTFPGYDLCGGWGSPMGMQLVYALMSYGTIWVDFISGQNPPAGNGSYNYPFLTITEAAAAAPINGNIYIRSAGTSLETPRFSKPVTVHAYNGSATIGP